MKFITVVGIAAILYAAYTFVHAVAANLNGVLNQAIR
jgi:hypothetical protein